MKSQLLFLLPALIWSFNAGAATTCSKANLTRCLDSACAINASSNPAARCQYCGTSDAGTPAGAKTMRSVSVGASAKYNISDKELKQAPTDAGQRYAWATTKCLAKVAGCTEDDVTDIYDPLIEQSCKAAGISAKMNQTLTDAAKTKTQSTCDAEIRNCMMDTKNCSPDFRRCESNTDFNKYFSTCSVDASGCDEFTSAIRDELMAARDNAIKNAGAILTQIVEKYKNARETKINEIKTGCRSNDTRDKCVETVCNRNMPNKCAEDSEKASALQLCKFYETACATVD